MAGPNGVGKTTFARNYLETLDDCSEFVNADEIERELTELRGRERQLHVGRIALEAMDRLASARRSFAIESTLSGRTLYDRIRSYRQEGYYVVTHFLDVAQFEQLRQRVAQRVAQGGHDIALADQIRRFDRCAQNFHELYKGISDEWTINDASHDVPRPILSGRGQRTEKRPSW